MIRFINNKTIPDRSGTGSTTTASAAAQRGDGGNYATVGRKTKRRGGKKTRRGNEARRELYLRLKIGTLNVGTMMGKGRDVADIDNLCVQETRWKGSKARNIGGGFK